MFDFETKEQREAWRVIANTVPIDIPRSQLLEAAARFDAREATCGIQPLSRWHVALEFVNNHGWDSVIESDDDLLKLHALKLLDTDFNFHWQITDKGREVLERLNAVCKVEK